MLNVTCRGSEIDLKKYLLKIIRKKMLKLKFLITFYFSLKICAGSPQRNYYFSQNERKFLENLEFYRVIVYMFQDKLIDGIRN